MKQTSNFLFSWQDSKRLCRRLPASGKAVTNLLQHFNAGIAAICADLGPRMDDVVILTMSEFELWVLIQTAVQARTK